MVDISIIAETAVWPPTLRDILRAAYRRGVLLRRDPKHWDGWTSWSAQADGCTVEVTLTSGWHVHLTGRHGRVVVDLYSTEITTVRIAAALDLIGWW